MILSQYKKEQGTLGQDIVPQDIVVRSYNRTAVLSAPTVHLCARQDNALYHPNLLSAGT